MGVNYIYVICEEVNPELVKIGFSMHPDKRVRELQTASPKPLTLFHKEEVQDLNARALERVIHRTLAHKRKNGEWFAMSPEDAVFEIKHALMKHGDNENLSRSLKNGTVIL
jgi:hypothetical protein